MVPTRGCTAAALSGRGALSTVLALCVAPEARKARCWPAPEVAVNVNRDEMGRLRLLNREIDDIVAFMRTLTDGYEPAPARAGR